MKGTVLVVDDDPLIRGSLGTLLRRGGYETFEAGTGEAAREWLRGEGRRADVAVVDWKLPGAGGREFASWILEACPGTGVVLVSGLGVEALRQHGLPAGRVQVLGKPFRSEELMGLLASLLQARRATGAA